MRTLIMAALVCAVVGLFLGLCTQLLAMAGQYNRSIHYVTGPILTICHSTPAILLSIALLNRQES